MSIKQLSIKYGNWRGYTYFLVCTVHARSALHYYCQKGCSDYIISFTAFYAILYITKTHESLKLYCSYTLHTKTGSLSCVCIQKYDKIQNSFIYQNSGGALSSANLQNSQHYSGCTRKFRNPSLQSKIEHI